ncbi:MerR family transcriptional regulator [Roseovarius autotrophicus]|uniref:MerR family transcriptional regulator n=1 Tax=Roseovarius autotrophicus TaxID=2824121 RepID=UPI0019FB428A|nr:MerR family transcriptional regulator [Roseovarius autotrophicus]MBE0452386.1 MerR family transcriptional regulator [Roseovarius sp.]
MAKSADAFRTISEVAEWLEVPAHVLRFWESKFTQVKPVKRAGGRRYYRPADMRLLAGIKQLLHDEGMTIKGVQKMLREEGVRHVSALAPGWSDEDEAHQSNSGAQVLSFSRAGGPEASPITAPDAAPSEADAAVPPALDAAPDAGPGAGVRDEQDAAPDQPQNTLCAPLPDLPGDPPDAVAADPGPLSRLAALRRPLAAPFARRLAAIAQDLRARSDAGQ